MTRAFLPAPEESAETLQNASIQRDTLAPYAGRLLSALHSVPTLETEIDQMDPAVPRTIGAIVHRLAIAKEPTDGDTITLETTGRKKEHSTLLSTFPEIAVAWQNADSESDNQVELADKNARISGFSFRDAIVEVNTHPVELDPINPLVQGRKCAILASFGFSNLEIGAQLGIGEESVNTHLDKLFGRYEMRKRIKLGPYFINNGDYTILELGATLPISLEEVEVAHLVASGFTNAEIGKKMHLSPDTIKSRLKVIQDKIGVRNREQITLAVLLSKPW